jgi:hypothetical protein
VRRLAVVLVLSALLVGCGGNGEAEEVLSQTAANLDEIRSGTLHFNLRIEPRGGDDAQEFGFALDGPFSFGSAGALPVADIEYTQVVGDQSATVTVISTGARAYVRTNGSTYEMPPEQANELRSASGELRSEGLGEFAIDEWIEDPELHDGGEVGGVETDQVTAELDVVAAVSDLLELVRGLGQDAPQLSQRDVERLADAVRSSRFELYTGKEDRLLRRLEVEVDFGLEVPAALRGVLGSLVGARVLFELGVDEPNRAVQVAEPENALPASQFPGSSG